MGTNYKYEASRWIQLMGEENYNQKLNEKTFETLKDQLIFHCKGINENMEHCNRYDMFFKQIEIAASELTYNEFIQILIDNQYNKK